MRRRTRRLPQTSALPIPSALLTFDLTDWAEWADVPLVAEHELAEATAFSGRPAMLEVRIAAMTDPAARHLNRAALRWSWNRRVWADEHGWPGDGIDRLLDESDQLDAWKQAHPVLPS